MSESRDWITEEHLKRRWNLKDTNDLGDKIIETGLQLYEDIFRHLHTGESNIKLVEKWRYDERYYRNLLFKTAKIIFRIEDIEDIEKKHPELIGGINTKIKHEYLFIREGPTSTIRYEGNPIRGLKGKGFDIIQYLLSHQRKVFTIHDLVKQFDGRDLSEIKLTRQDLIDGKTLKDLKEENSYLRRELTEAENNNDLERKEIAEKDLNKFIKYTNECLTKSGESRSFKNEISAARERISKRIKRALDKLNENDKNTWQHFQSALRPINSYFYSYNPDRDINWLTE